MKLPDGRVVRVIHERPIVGHWKDGTGKERAIYAAKGGKTTARIMSDEDTVAAEGVARVSPKDNYDKRLGRTIAIGRALKSEGKGEA